MSRKRTASVAGPAAPLPDLYDPTAGAVAPQAPVEQAAPQQAEGAAVTMYDQGGNPMQVSGSEASAKLARGEAFFTQGQKVPVKDDRGHVYELDASKAAQALATNSASVASQEELASAHEARDQNTITKSLEAGAVGVGRGLTLGLFDPAAIEAARVLGGDALADRTREHLLKLKEHHAIASTGGELLGAIAPVIISGGSGAAVEGGAAALEGAEAVKGGLSFGGLLRGAGAIPRGAAKVGEFVGEGAAHLVGEGASGLLGRIAQRAIPMAAQAGAEGAIYGAGATISETALGNEELTAEKLLAGAGHGAMLGAIAGGGLGASYELGRAAIDKGLKIIGKEGLQEFLQSVSDNQTIRALGANSRDIRNLGGVARSTEKAQERIGDIAETVRNYKFEGGQKLFSGTSSTAKLADGLTEAVDEAGAKLGKFRAKISELSGVKAELGPDTAKFFANFDEQIMKPAIEAGGTLKSRAERAAGEFATLQERVIAGEQPTLDELTKIRQNVDKILYPKKVMGVAPPPAEHFDQLLQARMMLEQTIEETTDRVVASTGNPEMQGAYVGLKQTFKDLADAKAMATAADMRALARNSVSLSDKMAFGAMAAGGLGGLPGALGAGITNHLSNTYGNAMMAAATNKAAALIGMQKAAGHVDEHMGEAITAFLSEQHETAELAEKISHVSRETTKTALEKREEMAHEHSAVPHEAPSLTDKEPSTPHERYDAVANQVRELQDPAKAAEIVAKHVGPVAEHAPNIGIQLASKVQSAAAYLAQKLPHSPIDGLYPTMPAHLPPNDYARAEFLRHADGTHPEVVLTHLKGLEVSHDEVEAFKATSPMLYEEAVAKLTMGAANAGQKGSVSYDKLVQLTTFTGSPAHPTLEPSFIKTVQALHASGAGNSKHSAERMPSSPKRMLNVAGGFSSASSKMSEL